MKRGAGRSICSVQRKAKGAVHFRRHHAGTVKLDMNGIDCKPERHWEEIQIPVPWGHVSGKWWGPRNKQPVIAIHGWQDNAGTWDRLIPLLPHDIPILAIDLPGHGLSSHLPTGVQYYVAWDGLSLVRRIANHFKWENITILGHSMGGIIGFLYAAAFPDDIEKLIEIDITGPPVRKLTNIMDSVRTRVEKFLKYEHLRPDQVPCYGYEEMLGIVFDAFRGSLTRESCAVLMKRGMKPSPNGPGYLFSRDVRLKANGVEFFSLDQLLHAASEIKCKYLNIRGNPGMVWDNPQNYDIVIRKLKEHTHVEYHVIEGSHHLHLNTPEKVSGIISSFLLDSTGDVV